ncbi:MAG: hypothetical protein AAFY28_16765 [Actinomycetota bacterium]
MTDLEQRLVATLERKAASVDISPDVEFLARRATLPTAVPSRRGFRPSVASIAASLLVATAALGFVVVRSQEPNDGAVVTDPVAVTQSAPNQSLEPVTTEPAPVATEPVAPSTTPSTTPAVDDGPASTTQLTEVVDVTETITEQLGPDPFVQWVVPWQGGFLMLGDSTSDLPLPDDRIGDLVASVPPEWQESITDSPNPTDEEVVDGLKANGLWNAAVSILLGDLAEPADSSGVLVYSSDGVEWAPASGELPNGDSTYNQGIAVHGDRLAIYTVIDDQPHVATTTDLVDWRYDPIAVPPLRDELPPVIMEQSLPGQLVANEAGWAVLYSYMYVLNSVVVAEQLGLDPDTASVSMSAGPTGNDTDAMQLTIGVGDSSNEETSVAPADLGLTEQDIDLLLDRGLSTSYPLVAEWDGAPAWADPVAASELVASADDIVALTYPDGVIQRLVDGRWVPVTTPIGGADVSQLVPLDDDIGAITGGPDGDTALLRLDPVVNSAAPDGPSGLPDGHVPVFVDGNAVTYRPAGSDFQPQEGDVYIATLANNEWLVTTHPPADPNTSSRVGSVTRSGQAMLIDNGQRIFLHR